MSDKAPMPEAPEAEPYARIEFHLQMQPHGTVTLHQADCGTQTLIGALKEDLRNLFGDPKDQSWFLRDTSLLNEKTLEYYGIKGIDTNSRNPTKILVKSSK
ncbi:unnamed protein product [Lymnaea stagnalis]|uniref:Ubiquitin-like domain-containing protein n=1 Tax=Lymnaea stagnalis TaxID=6523 RepID=A0AAV2I5A6_LYMST